MPWYHRIATFLNHLDTPTWGSMIAQGRSYLDTSWWVSALPGIVLTITVLGAFYFGDRLRDALDPRLRRQQPREADEDPFSSETAASLRSSR